MEVPNKSATKLNCASVGHQAAKLTDKNGGRRVLEFLDDSAKQLAYARTYGAETQSPEEVEDTDRKMEYLAELLKEKKQLDVFPHIFHNIDRLLNAEISRVRMALFQCNFSISKTELPEPQGEEIVIQEKIYVPVKEHPDYNFVGRILGPRGMTAKQLEQETGCKIMVRGRGSLRDRKKEEANRGKPNWEHLDDDLHVLVQCEDTPNRVFIKVKAAADEIRKLLVPVPDGIDDLKRKQLMELSIINGKYKPASKGATSRRLLAPVIVSPIRQAAQPVFISPMASPIATGTNVVAPTVASYLQSQNVEYNLMVNQLSFDTAMSAFARPQNSAYTTTAPIINTPSTLQPYFIDPLTPPGSTGSDHLISPSQNQFAQ